MKAEVVWTEVYFEFKLQSNQTYEAWIRKIMAIPGNAAKILAIGVKKSLDCSRIHSITKDHEDLELLVSWWSVKSHIFVAAWG